jgi:DNA alkylation repair enzyme
MIATLDGIRRGEFDHAFRIADLLLHDDHDLIHKAVGWLLREVGNRDAAAERMFLKSRYKAMPRTSCGMQSRTFRTPSGEGISVVKSDGFACPSSVHMPKPLTAEHARSQQEEDMALRLCVLGGERLLAAPSRCHHPIVLMIAGNSAGPSMKYSSPRKPFPSNR